MEAHQERETSLENLVKSTQEQLRMSENKSAATLVSMEELQVSERVRPDVFLALINECVRMSFSFPVNVCVQQASKRADA